MRIHQFSIRRYGPLPDTAVVRPADFSLFLAGNEEGKTLTVEALARMLLGRSARGMRGIERVQETPDGHVVLELNGEQMKLPEQGSLSELTEPGPEHWLNIFLIRNSDLSIEGQAEIYTSVADRLTGLKTEEIRAVTAELRDLGRLTPTDLRIANNEEHAHIGSRLERAGRLIDDTQELADRAEEEGLDRCERRLAEVRRRLKRIEGELARQQQARLRERYERCSAALDGLRKARRELKELEAFDADEAGDWADAEGTIERTQREHERLAGRAERLRERIEADRPELKRKQRELQTMQDRWRELSDLQPRLDRLKDAAAGAPTPGGLPWLAAAGAAVTALCLLGLLLSGHWAFWLIGLPFGAGTLLAGALWLRQWRTARNSQRDLSRALHEAAEAGISARTLTGLLAALRQFREAVDEAQGAVNDLETDLRVRRERLKELEQERIHALRAEEKKAEAKITEVQAKSGVEDLAQYRRRLQQKEELTGSANSMRAVLRNELSKEGRDGDDIKYWRESLEELEPYRDQAPGLEYDESEVQQLQRERTRLQEEAEQLRKRLAALREKLRDIEQEAGKVFREEADPTCTSLNDLKPLAERLRRFVGRYQREASVARSAIAIFERMNREEESKVARLFGPDRRVSAHFARITGGLYEAVLYEEEEGERRIRVRTREGRTLDAAALSGGAYDQLYLSIRVALAELILGGEPGFFIMDDPFVKADAERLARQLALLGGLVESGWQVLYFTAKAEVREALGDEIADGTVRQIDLPGIHG